MDAQTLIENQWEYLLTFLPSEQVLGKLARETGAIVRQRRLGSASELLRCALIYSICGYSLRGTAAWAELHGIGAMSDVALLKRLKKASGLLGKLVGLKLAERATPPPTAEGGLRLRLVDATCISRPGSKGADWRLHLMFDVGRMAIQDVEVTDATGGESLGRFSVGPGEVVVGDRGYIHRKGFAHIKGQGGELIVRLGWQSLPMSYPTGGRFDLLSAVRSLPEAAIGEYSVIVNETKLGAEVITEAFPARVVAVRKSEEAATETRRRIIKEHSKKGKVADSRTLEAASYVFLLTTLDAPRMAASRVFDVYRFRWQIELCFKRLKSLLELDKLLARDPDLAKTFIYGKLLAALLLDELSEAFLAFSPWGFRIDPTTRVIMANSPHPS